MIQRQLDKGLTGDTYTKKKLLVRNVQENL